MVLVALGITILVILRFSQKSTMILSQFCRRATMVASALAAIVINATVALAQTSSEGASHTPGGEANLKLPDLSQVEFLGGVNGHSLLLIGFIVSFLGVVFGFIIFTQLKKLPVHRSMREISELIYETCKTYLITQGKLLLIL